VFILNSLAFRRNHDEMPALCSMFPGFRLCESVLLRVRLSNFAILSAIVGVLILVSAAMQFIHGEDTQLQLWSLLSPFLLMTLPAMLVISALAVLFEAIPWLRGGGGNVLYFFLWIGLVSTAILPSMAAGGQEIIAVNDLFGMSTLLSDMSRAVRQHFPAYDGRVSVGYEIREGSIALQTFRWEGMAWTPLFALMRVFWIGVATAITFLTALFFHRFDPERVQGRTILGKTKNEAEQDLLPASGPTTLSTYTLTPLAPHTATSGSIFWRTVLAELRLMLQGRPAVWLVVAAGLIIAGLLSDTAFARQWLLPCAWIWPLTLWSAMGTREAQHATEQIIFSTPHPLRHQFAAMWLAGVIVAVLAGSGVAVNLVLAKAWHDLFAWAVGALFIPALALFAGTWSGGPKLFEVVYVMLWYAGPINRVGTLDFMGAAGATSENVAQAYLFITTILLLLAFLGRMRRARV
jgi:hypothetical protein